MESDDLQSLVRLLLYGSADTRRQAAQRLCMDGSAEWWPLLAGTVRSTESWLLRARCLELLGLAAASGDQRTAELILGLLDGSQPQP